MITVTFIAADGTSTCVEAKAGSNIAEVALNAGIDGITGECGGSMACGTCHCFVDNDWFDKTGPYSNGEEDMLEGVFVEPRPTSRLACQIELTEALNGIIIHLPEAQT